MLAVIEQKNSSGPLGNINPALYALAQGTSATTVFHDVGLGDNVVPCVLGTPDCGESNTFDHIGYGAIGGYDQVTGLGSISATGLATALSANTPAVSLAVSPSAPVVGQPVIFTATVLGSNPAPTGTVVFSIGGTAVSPAVPLTQGVASFKYSGFSSPYAPLVGQFSITASYSGDSTYAASSANLALIATQVPVKLTISSSTNPLQTNTATRFNFTAAGQYGTPTGYVLLLVDGFYVANASSPVPLVNGVATYSYPGFSSAGLHEVTATYYSEFDKQNGQIPNSGYVYPYTAYEGGQAVLDFPVSSSTQTLTPTVTLTPNSSTTGVLAPKDDAEFSILLKGNGSVAPTGGYTLTVDGSSSLQQFGAAIGDGLYSLTLGAHWIPGTHTVQVTYNGDDNYKPAAPALATFIVVLPAFTLAASPSTVTIATGSSGSTALTVNAGATYSGSTTFQLALLSYTGAPFSGCFGLSSTDPQSQRGTPTSVTLTMYSGTSHCSTSNHIGALSAATAPPVSNLFPISVASLCIAGCFAFRRRKMGPRFLIALVSATLISAVGCGGSSTGSSGNGGNGSGGPTTPAVVGTYVFQVVGISATDSTVVAKTTFTLIVQGT